MFSQNIQQHNQYGWLNDDKNQTHEQINELPSMSPNCNIFIDDQADIISKNDRNSVSDQVHCKIILSNTHGKAIFFFCLLLLYLLTLIRPRNQHQINISKTT